MKKDIELIVKNVTNKIIAELESADPSKWMKCWANKKNVSVDGHYYTGFNTFILSMLNNDRGIYGTFLQWKKKNCNIKKGEKATKIVLYSPFNKEVENADGTTELKTFRFMKAFPVFNISQVEGDLSQFDGMDTFKKMGADTVEKAESFVNNLNAKINYVEGSDRAYYAPASDAVTMPSKNSFFSRGDSTATENFYCVLFHELTHWTGHSSRLNRLKGSLFGSKDYAFEELVAEMGSAFIANSLDISAQPRADHARYLKSWLSCLKNEPNALLKASGLANKALMFMTDKQPKKQPLKKVA